VDAKAADGTEATVKAGENGAKVEGDGGTVEANKDGSTAVKKGEDSVETTKDGGTKVKSGETEVIIGKDGKVDVSGAIPGM